MKKPIEDQKNREEQHLFTVINLSDSDGFFNNERRVRRITK